MHAPSRELLPEERHIHGSHQQLAALYQRSSALMSLVIRSMEWKPMDNLKKLSPVRPFASTFVREISKVVMIPRVEQWTVRMLVYQTYEFAWLHLHYYLNGWYQGIPVTGIPRQYLGIDGASNDHIVWGDSEVDVMIAYTILSRTNFYNDTCQQGLRLAVYLEGVLYRSLILDGKVRVLDLSVLIPIYSHKIGQRRA